MHVYKNICIRLCVCEHVCMRACMSILIYVPVYVLLFIYLKKIFHVYGIKNYCLFCFAIKKYFR